MVPIGHVTFVRVVTRRHMIDRDCDVHSRCLALFSQLQGENKIRNSDQGQKKILSTRYRQFHFVLRNNN